MRQRASGTFLWVALVFNELLRLEEVEYEHDSDVLDVLKMMPDGLMELYDKMMRQIDQLERHDPQHCRSVPRSSYSSISSTPFIGTPDFGGARRPLERKGRPRKFTSVARSLRFEMTTSTSFTSPPRTISQRTKSSPLANGHPLRHVLPVTPRSF